MFIDFDVLVFMDFKDLELAKFNISLFLNIKDLGLKVWFYHCLRMLSFSFREFWCFLLPSLPLTQSSSSFLCELSIHLVLLSVPILNNLTAQALQCIGLSNCFSPFTNLLHFISFPLFNHSFSS